MSRNGRRSARHNRRNSRFSKISPRNTQEPASFVITLECLPSQPIPARTAHALSITGAVSTHTRPLASGASSEIRSSNSKPLTHNIVIVVAPGISRDLSLGTLMFVRREVIQGNGHHRASFREDLSRVRPHRRYSVPSMPSRRGSPAAASPAAASPRPLAALPARHRPCRSLFRRQAA
jgi:hypothetical protein